MGNDAAQRPGQAIQAVREVPGRLVGHQLLMGLASVAELHDARGADMISGAGLFAGAYHRGQWTQPRKILASSIGTIVRNVASNGARTSVSTVTAIPAGAIARPYPPRAGEADEAI
jgi:hypothetical protein